MCRLYGFIANEPTKVDCSLVFSQNALMMQSRIDETGRNHADGWGITTYQQGMPVLTKKATAAFADQHFSAVAEKAYSTSIVAHVRRATVGEISWENTHPFISGKWTFAHNGTVTGFARIRSALEMETVTELQQQRLGDTDSEQYFLWLLSRLRSAGLEDWTAANEDQVTDLLGTAVKDLDQRCRQASPDLVPKLNFVLTDGSAMVYCRWNRSLHMICRRGIYNCEICGIPHIHHHETVNHRAVVVASEPVTSDHWDEIPNETVQIVRL